MINTLSHRGPDGFGIVILNSAESEAKSRSAGDVGLGHRRLAIIDLSPRGRQPMRSTTGYNWITFNGEIYNYLELRAELEALGYQFHSDTDTEVLLASYEAWGETMLGRLIGMFAFAIWDAKRHEMFIARDRLGIKPLYYYEKDRHFACASELKSLLAYPDFAGDVDKDALRLYLVKGYIPAPATIFQHVRKLPPGHLLRVRPGQSSHVIQYWDAVPYYTGPHQDYDEVEVQDRLDDLLQSAVRYRMISDVPVGALLSGGVDSSLVVALMQEQSIRPVKTFTIAFDTPRYNEAPHAKAVAQHLGTEHHELVANEQNLLGFVGDLVNFYDEPFADTSAIPTYAVSAMARQQVTVALSGDGGDETHLGYPTYQWLERREQVRRWLPASLVNVGAELVGRLPQRRFRRLSRYVSFATPLEAHLWVVSYWDWADLPLLLSGHNDGARIIDSYERVVARLPGVELLQQVATADLVLYMADDVLTKVDRASMAVGLEVRVPLLDHRVVEYSAGLPVHMKRRRGVGKYLLRKLLNRRVPQELIDRPKQGFSVPLAQWLQGPLKDLLLSTLTSSRLKIHGLFQTGVVDQHVHEHLDGKHDHSKKLWSLLVFQMWYDRYLACRR
jgi:asparagine synthase (glutamine-hydrolysing)